MIVLVVKFNLFTSFYCNAHGLLSLYASTSTQIVFVTDYLVEHNYVNCEVLTADFDIVCSSIFKCFSNGRQCHHPTYQWKLRKHMYISFSLVLNHQWCTFFASKQGHEPGTNESESNALAITLTGLVLYSSSERPYPSMDSVSHRLITHQLDDSQMTTRFFVSRQRHYMAPYRERCGIWRCSAVGVLTWLFRIDSSWSVSTPQLCAAVQCFHDFQWLAEC